MKSILKSRILGSAALLALLTLGVSARATTLVFSGSDIAGLSSSVNITSTPTVGDGYVSTPAATVRTYGPSANVSSFNAWLNSLGTGEGISAFNLWLQDGHSNQAALWGEEAALADAYATDITVWASAGWTASVYTLQTSDWGAAWAGRKLLMFEATDPAYYLRPGSTATFGLSADIMGNNGATGPYYQIWVGSSSIVDSNGATFFQRAVSAHVPDSSSVLVLLSLGMISLVAIKRRLA